MNSNDKNLNQDKHLEQNRQADADANRDPITGQPGAHPVGTGVGAGVAGAIGTAIGAAAGPVGAVVGAVVGSVAGGLAGKAAAELFDPTVEDTYWRENYASRPYAQSNHTYDDYAPAYRTGYEGYGRYANEGKTYEEVEPELQRQYETNYKGSRVGWDNAKYAAKDAWHRVHSNTSTMSGSTTPSTTSTTLGSTSFNDDDYWRQNYASRPYYEPGMSYDRYQPAYQMGYEGYNRYRDSGRTYDDIEPELRRDYEQKHGSSGLSWEKAKMAVRDSWERVEDTFKRR